MPRCLPAALSLALSSLVFGCSERGASSSEAGTGSASNSAGATGEETGESSPSTSAPTTTATTNSTTPGDTDTDTEESATSVPFVPEDPDIGLGCAALSQCDPFAQDCPDGEKCGPRYVELCGYAITVCMPITDIQGPGESCELTPSGDNCDADSFCYPGLLGFDEPSVCVPRCEGTPDDPSCLDEAQACAFGTVHWDGPLGCMAKCDPLGPDICAPYEACTLGNYLQTDFTCMVAPAKLEQGEPCYANSTCNGGLCADQVLVEGCLDDHCCTALCDELAPDCPPGHSCVHVEVDDPESTVGACLVD